MRKVGTITAEQAVEAAFSMCRAFNQEKSKMEKVRPMLDKDLRDEIVNYCGGGESFNLALRYYVKGKARAENFAHIGRVRLKEQEKYITDIHTEISQKDMLINELTQEVAKLHNEKAGLNASIKDVEDNCIKIFNQVAPTMEVIAGLMMGTGIGLLVGVFFL